MKYYSCKCGEKMAFGTDPPSRCLKCKKCGTGLSSLSGQYPEPLPHDFSAIDTIMTDQGEHTVTRCRYCFRAKWKIEEEEKGNEKAEY